MMTEETAKIEVIIERLEGLIDETMEIREEIKDIITGESTAKRRYTFEDDIAAFYK
jgi:uncharacterized protein (UPF0335 family)